MDAASATLAISVASASKQSHKGGHRVKAIQLVNDAMVEVEKGIESAE